MKHSHYSDYIVPESIRRFYYYSFIFGTLVFLCCSCILWFINGSQDPQSGFIVFPVIFTALTVYDFVLGMITAPVVNIRYSCENDCICNYFRNQFKSVHLNSEYSYETIKVKFFLAKGSISIDPCLVSDKPNRVLSFNQNGGLNTIRALWKAGIIMCPEPILRDIV